MSTRKNKKQQQGTDSPSSSLFDSASNTGSPVTDGRRRQQKRDEQIRKKLESELSKRRNQVGKQKQLKRPPPGTVLSLRPSPPLTMKYTTTIHEAAQYMSAKRENCVLVLDDEESICGIFTAKDLAFKIVGSGLDAKSHTIEDIMTANPMCASTDTNATEALNLMVSKGFRHLPVMDENQNVAGVLDITKCFFEAMQKLERAYTSSRKLHDALEGVQSELGPNQPSHIISYVEALKQRTEGPDLESVLGVGTPVFVDVRTSVAEAAALMKEHRTTAVLVTDHDSIAGIFTSKDVVLRVLAAGLDPRNCSVVRVMTPQPDFAPKSMSIQSALRKMHEGHYLNLPVMGDDNEVVGIVDVLKLTYATLEQINSMNTGEGEGPAWNKFWMSLENDTESAHSDQRRSSTPFSERRSNAPDLDMPNSPMEVSSQELAQFNIGDGVGPGPEDSVSRQGQRLVSFPFKFKAPSGRVHRVTVTTETTLSEFRTAVAEKLTISEVETLGGKGEIDEEDKLIQPGFAVSYIDDEGDPVAITTCQDLVDAVNICRACNLDKGDLYVHHPDTQVEVEAKPIKKASQQADQLVPGVANELLLPGAIAALAASILVVFAFKKK